MGGLSPEHWLIVAVIVVLLFGSKKLPDLARGLGQSMRILKAETRGAKDDAAPERPTERPEPAEPPRSSEPSQHEPPR